MVLGSDDFPMSPQRLCTLALEEGLVSPVVGRAWRFTEQGPEGWIARGRVPSRSERPARLSSFYPLKQGTELPAWAPARPGWVVLTGHPLQLPLAGGGAP